MSNFNAVASGFAIHHGRDVDEYASLYRRVKDVLLLGLFRSEPLRRRYRLPDDVLSVVR